jgi:hypothetical protein
MAAVDGLVLDGEAGNGSTTSVRVRYRRQRGRTPDALPPKIHHKDVVGRGQVYADATGLDAQHWKAQRLSSTRAP